MSRTRPSDLVHLLPVAVLCVALLAVPASAQSSSVAFDGADLRYDVVYSAELNGHFAGATAVRSAPTALDVAPDGRVFFTEINGAVRVLEPDSGDVATLGVLFTNGDQCRGCPEPAIGEGGIHGFALAPDFADTGHLYISYAVANSSCDVPDNIAGSLTTAGESNAGCYHLSRFTVGNDVLGNEVLDTSSEDVILTWPFSRFPRVVNGQPVGTVNTGHAFRTSAHHGGGIEVLPDGSIAVTVGDHTDPEASGGYGPRDSRPEFWWQNAERTAQNPADRRGKLLRVMPDGSVPVDNPFVGQVGEYAFGEGTVEYDPYILAMGMRNPYRLAADPVTGTVYSGQVGPDARVADPQRGPAGVEELNVVGRAACADGTEPCPYEPFNGGYPRCIGPNRPYIDFDYTTGASTGVPLSCDGFDEPDLWYPLVTVPSDQWPQLQVGSGSTILPAEVYRSDAPDALVDLQGDLLLFDWSRGWLATIPVEADGQLDVATDAVDVIATGFSGPIDAAVAPDGSVYVLEYGTYGSVRTQMGRIACASCAPASVTDVPLPETAAASLTPWVVAATLGLSVFGLRRGRDVI